nr:PREDICTED: 60 kDa SS-A/Ro ribonucleoprotein-like [Bemisia tabaci]
MAVPPEIRLKRFLHYASEEGIYIAQPRRSEDFFPDNIKSILALVPTDEGGENVILPSIEKVFKEGTSIAPTSVMFALAVCATQTESEKLRVNAQRKARALLLNEEDLFDFAHYCYKLSTNKGGQGMRRTITKWYEKKTPQELAEVVAVKNKIHRLRHKDLMRLYHMKSEDRAKQAIFSYIMTDLDKTKEAFKDHLEAAAPLEYIGIVEQILTTTEESVAVDLLTKHKPKIPPHSLPPKLHLSSEVWSIIASTLTLDQMLQMTQHFFKLKLLKNNCPFAAVYADRIANEAIPPNSKIDPTQAFIELKTFEMLPRKKEYFKMLKKKGHDVLPESVVAALRAEEAANSTEASSNAGDKKKNEDLYPTFKLNKKIIEALNNLVVRSFKSLKPTGKRFLIGVDTRNVLSTVMYVKCPFVKSIDAAALLLQSFLQAENGGNEKKVTVTSFLESSQPNTSSYRIEELTALKAGLSLQETTQILSSKTGGPVNVLKFFDWAAAKKKDVDVFVLISTSNITPCDPYNGIVHYCEELKKEEQNVKLITISLNGMCSKPKQYYKKSNMLYINGFDDKVWRIIQEFCRSSF